MSLLKMRRRRAANKGFNLIEAAIVLGIVGLVVGGIWVAATSVYANLRSKRATDELLGIAQSVRALFATSTTMNNAAADMTAVMAQANVLPSDTLTTTPAAALSSNTANPWAGGNISVGSYIAAGTQFYITFSNVPTAACVDFVSRNTGPARDSGMLGVVGAAGTSGAVLPVPGAIGVGAMPVAGTALTLANIQNAAVCNSAAAGLVNVSFIFTLRG